VSRTTFRIEEQPDDHIFRLIGELDLDSSEDFLHGLGSAVQRGGDIRLDVSDLRFIDSSGIRALIVVSQQLGDRGQIVLRAPKGEVARVLELIKAETFPNLSIDRAVG
jgi:anti-anti-sigma factor